MYVFQRIANNCLRVDVHIANARYIKFKKGIFPNINIGQITFTVRPLVIFSFLYAQFMFPTGFENCLGLSLKIV